MQLDLPISTIGNGDQADLQTLLAPDENVLATLDVDLDHELRFRPGRLVLTGKRLLAHVAGAPGASSEGWCDWPLREGLSLHHSDYAGVGCIELHDQHRRLALWRFTLSVNVLALRWMAKVERQLAQLNAPATGPIDGD